MSNSNKECHTSNNDIMTNCLAIFDATKATQKKHLKSSHGIARRLVDQYKDKALLAEVLNDDFAHCKDIC